eukprot:3796690-Pleurochrysis_carterae.AAC.1
MAIDIYDIHKVSPKNDDSFSPRPAMAPPSAAQLQEDEEESYEANGVTGHLRLRPLGGPVRGIGYLGIPNGSATRTGALGHYITNSASGLVPTVVSLPAIVQFSVSGVADALAVSFKLAANGKMYAQCINT